MDDSIVVKPQTLSKGRLWTALVAILLGQFVVAIDLTVLNIALPELTRDLSPSSDQLLWIVDVYSLVLAGFLVATSSLSDRFGRKKMVRKALVPCIPRVRSSAMAKASTLMNTSETSAKSAVYQNEWTKLASFSALM